MTLPLNKEVLAAAYEYLKTTPPFSKWNMADSEDVKFTVASFRRLEFGRYQWDGKQHTINMSSKAIGYTSTLLEKMAHEMIHMHLEETGMESRKTDSDTHNTAFRKFAAEVCKIHGFDPRAFY